MAVHTGLSGRDSGERRVFYRCVAVPAINTEAAHVMLVAEGHWLLDGHLGARGVVRSVQFRPRPDEKGQNEDPAEYAEPRKCVGAGMENLGHRTMSRDFPGWRRRKSL